MIPRVYTQVILEYLYQVPCVLVSGPRQAGKTSLVELLVQEYPSAVEVIDLEKDEDADKLRIPGKYFDAVSDRLVVIDEIHRMPSLLPHLKRMVEQGGRGLHFLLLGTGEEMMEKVCIQLGRQKSVHLRLRPLNCLEIKGISDQTSHWHSGGFVTPLQMQDQELRPVWYGSYLRGLAERDMPLAGLREHPELVRRILPFIAESTGLELNKLQIAKELDIRPETLNKVLATLTSTGILLKLDPYTAPKKKRLIRSPRYFLSDSGLLHYLLSIRRQEQLLVSAWASSSWSSYVINQISGIAFPPLQLRFYQTHDGAGCDILLMKGKNPVCCISTQYAEKPVIRRGFSTAILDMKTRLNLIIIPGKDLDVPLRHNIRMCDVVTACKKIEELRQYRTRKIYIPRRFEESAERFDV